MKWEFILKGGLVSVTLKAEIIYTSYQIEEIKVTGDGISIVLQNNRPLLVAIERNLPIIWKLIEGTIKDPTALNRITAELEQYLKSRKEPVHQMGANDFAPVKKSA